MTRVRDFGSFDIYVLLFRGAVATMLGAVTSQCGGELDYDFSFNQVPIVVNLSAMYVRASCVTSEVFVSEMFVSMLYKTCYCKV